MKAAQEGYPPAEYRTGYAYAYGEGVEKNLVKAIEWYELSAYKNYANAQRSLDKLYLEGKDNIKKQPALAYAWYQLVAERGNARDIKRRDSLRQNLSRSELKQSQEMLASIKQKI